MSISRFKLFSASPAVAQRLGVFIRSLAAGICFAAFVSFMVYVVVGKMHESWACDGLRGFVWMSISSMMTAIINVALFARWRWWLYGVFFIVLMVFYTFFMKYMNASGGLCAIYPLSLIWVVCECRL